MFPNWTGWKWAKLGLTAAIGATTGMASATLPDTWHSADVTANAVLIGILGIVITLSGTSMGPALAKK